MAGCGGNCRCNAEQQAQCGRNEQPRNARPLAEAIAQVIVDNRVAMKALEVFEAGGVTKEEAIILARSELNLH